MHALTKHLMHSFRGYFSEYGFQTYVRRKLFQLYLLYQLQLSLHMSFALTFLYIVLQPLFYAGDGAVFDRTPECWKDFSCKRCCCEYIIACIRYVLFNFLGYMLETDFLALFLDWWI